LARFDRYLLSQLMVFFGFFALVLVMVYWVNQAVLLFDRLIADGQSATVFLEFTALTLPNVIRIVLPVAGFAASVYATNRLSSESELVVVQAMGFSSFRLARAVLVFGTIVALLTAILANILVPISETRLTERSAEIKNNITARFLTEGEFLHPTDGITFYIREITPQGELKDVFMSDSRNADNQVIYTAKNAFLVREETGPKLVMFDGMAQTLAPATNRLFTTSFSDFSYDIGGLIESDPGGGRSVSEISTLDLMFPTPALLEETGHSTAILVYSGHKRIAQPLLAIIMALIGFAALLVGNFSRFGVIRQIIAAILLVILVRVLDSVLIEFVRRDENLWWLLYVPVLTGFLITALLLWMSERPGQIKRMFQRRVATA